MIIVHERKRKQFIDLFSNEEKFREFLVENYSCLNFESDNIKEKIKTVYSNLINLDEIVQYTRLARRLSSSFGFLYKNVTKKEYWIERGWSDSYAREVLDRDKLSRAKKQSETKQNILKNKDTFISDGELKEFRFISGKFQSINLPVCNICKSILEVKKVNVNNCVDKFYYKIKGCSNAECKSNTFSKNEKYRAFLPEREADKVINKIANNIKQKNILSIENWINKGYSEEEAKKEIFKIQSENSKKRKTPFIPTRENLKKYGYSEIEINEICLSPTQEKFWINKGLSEDEAKEKVICLQKENSIKFIEKRKNNPGAYSAVTHTQLAYWINNGYSEEEAGDKLKERQRTFSLEKCIEKFGEEDGQNRWRNRQEKWLKNYKRNNYSKISQELFWSIYEKLPLCYRVNNEIYFATLNQESKNKEEENKNNEFRLKLKKQVILPDFFVLNKKKIIEFDGVYYHRVNPENQKRELQRDEQIKETGYEVFHVNELEYKKNKQEVINKCLNFLEIKI